MMNSARFLAVIALFGGLLASSVHAAIPAISNNVKEASDATPYRRAIENFIKDRVAKLANPVTMDKAREELVNETLVDGENRASMGYLDVYASTLGKLIVPLASNPTMRVRLNAAIVVAKVAARINSTRLIDAVSLFLDDNSSAVTLWAIKASGSVLPAAIADSGAAKTKAATLLSKLTDAVIRHNKAVLYDEAYLALSLNVTRGATAPRRVLAVVVPRLQQLLESRVNQYLKGIPEDPSAEGAAILALCNEEVWGSNAEARSRTVQNFLNLLSLVSQRLADPSVTDRAPLIDLIRFLASAISVNGERIQSQAILDSASRLAKVSVRTTPEEIQAAAADLDAVVRKASQFKDLKPSPTIEAEPAPAPTAPSAQPAANPQ